MSYFFAVNGKRYVSDKPFTCPVCGGQAAANIFPVIEGALGRKFVELDAMPGEACWSDTHNDATCEDCA